MSRVEKKFAYSASSDKLLDKGLPGKFIVGSELETSRKGALLKTGDFVTKFEDCCSVELPLSS